jgi:hypothetical protein
VKFKKLKIYIDLKNEKFLKQIKLFDQNYNFVYRNLNFYLFYGEIMVAATVPEFNKRVLKRV